MQKIPFFFVFILATLFVGCEDVVDVDLNTAPPKLVIEAAIKWQKGTSGNLQRIRLTTTTDYFSNSIPKVSGAIVTITNSTNTVFNFVEAPNTGEYFCSNFVPKINETYTLTVVSKGQTYTATESLQAVAPITKLEQKNDGGFTGDQIEVKTFYNDPAGTPNYYLYKFTYSNQVKSNLYVDRDEFFDGNDFFSISQNDELKKGDKIEIAHYGISKAYYNYMSILANISGNNGGGPFQSPPATVRGNILNTTDKANYPLGYFSLSEIDQRSYTIQ
ncbi:DUF4249 domain-containing protein [Flavobacterium sp. RSSA_27]|uniref:DUF4249 domain-containing protein n=1 Tax=Flavobacterium sp. RSSA_27 TaxID=3447667 RepID=UPI003F3A12C5